ncbi:hypothetical protein J6590_054375 [Homalodisca vitripennis]|nr:hypothetical protein J6590_054375 [Homalodisca vitripennis]
MTHLKERPRQRGKSPAGHQGRITLFVKEELGKIQHFVAPTKVAYAEATRDKREASRIQKVKVICGSHKRQRQKRARDKNAVAEFQMKEVGMRITKPVSKKPVIPTMWAHN